MYIYAWWKNPWLLLKGCWMQLCVQVFCAKCTDPPPRLVTNCCATLQNGSSGIDENCQNWEKIQVISQLGTQDGAKSVSCFPVKKIRHKNKKLRHSGTHSHQLLGSWDEEQRRNAAVCGLWRLQKKICVYVCVCSFFLVCCPHGLVMASCTCGAMKTHQPSQNNLS